MSGIIKRLFLVVVNGRFKKTVLGPFTSKKRADELIEFFDKDPEVRSVWLDEMPVNPDPPINIIDWFDAKFPK